MKNSVLTNSREGYLINLLDLRDLFKMFKLDQLVKGTPKERLNNLLPLLHVLTDVSDRSTRLEALTGILAKQGMIVLQKQEKDQITVIKSQNLSVHLAVVRSETGDDQSHPCLLICLTSFDEKKQHHLFKKSHDFFKLSMTKTDHGRVCAGYLENFKILWEDKQVAVEKVKYIHLHQSAYSFESPESELLVTTKIEEENDQVMRVQSESLSSTISRYQAMNPNLKILIVGHGVAASIGLLLAESLERATEGSIAYVLLFGAHRVGNKHFQNHYDNELKLKQRTYNFQTPADLKVSLSSCLCCCSFFSSCKRYVDIGETELVSRLNEIIRNPTTMNKVREMLGRNGFFRDALYSLIPLVMSAVSTVDHYRTAINEVSARV